MSDMFLKKLNAVISLLTILGMLIHAGYSIFAYLTMYYNPVIKTLTAYPFLICVCLHALLGMFMVFFRTDGMKAGYYPKQNLSTIIQRVSALIILLMLLMHIRMFDLMKNAASKETRFFWWFLVFCEIIFFGAVIAHISVSFSKALITLGLLSSVETKKKIDRTMYVLGTVVFAVSVFAVVRGQMGMFLHP